MDRTRIEKPLCSAPTFCIPWPAATPQLQCPENQMHPAESYCIPLQTSYRVQLPRQLTSPSHAEQVSRRDMAHGPRCIAGLSWLGRQLATAMDPMDYLSSVSYASWPHTPSRPKTKGHARAPVEGPCTHANLPPLPSWPPSCQVQPSIPVPT